MSAQRSSEFETGRFERAFLETTRARDALDEGELFSINLDVQQAATTVMGALPSVRSLRATIAKELPGFDLSALDTLGPYADAAVYAQTRYLLRDEPSPSPRSLLTRGAEVRRQLLMDVTSLARRELIDTALLSELKGGAGYLNIGSDIGVLVRALRASWANIEGKCAIQPSELDDAHSLSEETIAFGSRGARQPAQTGRAAGDRARAYTLMVSAYDEVRRAVSYLRWHEGDADKLTPSLWSGRGGR